MLNSERHKRVRKEGYQSGLNKKPKDNPYSKLGKKGQVYASIWDAGYSDGVKDIEDCNDSESK